MRSSDIFRRARRPAFILAVTFLLLSAFGCAKPDMVHMDFSGTASESSTEAAVSLPDSSTPAETSGTGPSSHSGWIDATRPEPVTTPSRVTAAPTVPVQADPSDVSEAPPATLPPEDKPVNAALTPVRKSDYYGLQQLQSMPRADHLVAAYQRIAAGVEACETTISLKDSQHPITPSELTTVFNCYRFDYPQHFWLDLSSGSYSYSYSGSTVLSVVLKYSLTGSALTEAQSAFASAAAAMLEGLHAGMSEAERERILHDRLVEAVSYDTTFEKPHIYNAYGALVGHTAVCEGYARAMQFLLYQAGIQCLIATGESKGESHAWNVVRIDGSYYHLDPTWDDPISRANFPFISYAYFNVTDQEIRQDHTIGGDGYALPACTATAAQYYRSRGLVYTAYSAADVAALVKAARENRETIVRLWVDGDAKAYAQSILNDWSAICQKADSYGRIQLITPSSSEILFSLS